MSKRKNSISARTARTLVLFTVEVGVKTLASTTCPKQAWKLWSKLRLGGYPDGAQMYRWSMERKLVGEFVAGQYFQGDFKTGKEIAR